MHTYACISQHKKLHKQSVSTEWHLACILTTKSRYIYIYIYVERHVYIHIYIYHAALLSGYVVVAPKTFEIKWHDSLTSLRFVCLTWLNVCGSMLFSSQSRLGNSIGHDFMSKVSFVLKSSIDVWLGGHPTFVNDPNIGSSPQTRVCPHKIGGGKGVGNEVGRVKLKFYTHNFVSFPPTHHMLEGKCHTKQISLIFFECTTLEKCNMHYE